MDNTTYYQRNKEIILNRAKDYCEYDKERLRELARNKYRNLSEARIEIISKTKISKSKRV